MKKQSSKTASSKSGKHRTAKTKSGPKPQITTPGVFAFVGILLCVSVLVYAGIKTIISESESVVNGQIQPASIDHADAASLFEAEESTGVPLEALAALCSVRDISFSEADTVVYDFTTAQDPEVSPFENAKRLIASLEDGKEQKKALKAVESYRLLGEIRRDKIYPLPVTVRTDFADSWGEGRNNGRSHEGTDIFADLGTEVYSVCAGTVEKKGWLELGGYRIGIRGDDGIYYYYAHLSAYADAEVGDRVEAGTLIGYVGDTGYGPEGTTGMFAPHLHFGMYQGEGKTEKAFDPYPFLVQWKKESEASQ